MIKDGQPIEGNVKIYFNRGKNCKCKNVCRKTIMKEIDQLMKMIEDLKIVGELNIISHLVPLIHVIYLSRENKYEIELYFNQLSFGAKRPGKIVSERTELHEKLMKIVDL